jgi:hypothetical protein
MWPVTRLVKESSQVYGYARFGNFMGLISLVAVARGPWHRNLVRETNSNHTTGDDIKAGIGYLGYLLCIFSAC